MRQNLEKLTDDTIREEYVKRYTLKAGARLLSARTTADHLRGFYAESKYKESFVMICLNAQHEIIDTRGALHRDHCNFRRLPTRAGQIDSA